MARPSPGVRRVVAVLDHLAAHPGSSFGLSELCRALDLNKATGHSLLGELTDAGYLARDPVDKTYTLGPQLLAIGLAARRPERDAVERARPHLRRLARRHDARCVVTTIRGSDMVSLETAGHDRPLGPSLQPGHRIPFDPPLGTAFLVGASDGVFERWLGRAGRELTQEERTGYVAAIEAVKTLGCSLSLDAATRPLLAQAVVSAGDRSAVDLVHELADQPYLLTELRDDRRYRLSVIVAPVIGPEGNVILGLTIYDLNGSRSGVEVRQLAAEMCEAATAISESIGGVPLVPSRPQVVAQAPRQAKQDGNSARKS